MSGTEAAIRGPVPVTAGSAVPRRRRGELAFAVGLLVLLAVGGALVGLAWARLAPDQSALVLPDGRSAVLPGQAEHRFDDLAVFALLGLAVGVVAGAALWRFRRRRGPLALLVVTAGSLLGGWLARDLGTAVAPAGPLVSAGEVMRLPAVLDSDWVLLVQPLGAVLVYMLLAAGNGRPDLDRRPS